MKKWFNKLYEKKISATGLAVFRIAFFLNLFFEIIHLFKYRHLYFDTIPFIEESSVNMSFFILIWILILGAIVFGLFTRIFTILNYVFCVAILSSFTDFEYHMHYVYVGISFITIFMPLSRVFSLDNIFFKIKKTQNVSVLYYYMPIVVGIGFVYFDSVFHKLTSQIWLNGLGVWFPASLPQITILNDQWLLNQKLVMLFLGYLTFIFEALFIFFFWIKKMRIPIFIIGTGLHIGILLEFPIPNFALGMMALYLLIVPVKFWDRFKDKVHLFKPGKYHYFSNSLISFDKRFGLVTVILVLFFLQINVTLQSPFIKPILDRTMSKIGINEHYDGMSSYIMKFSTKVFGITKHPVFMDNHFKEYNHILLLTYEDYQTPEKILPIIDRKGMVGDYLKGGVWVNWSYRVNSPNINPIQLEKGLCAYTAYWAYKNNIDLSNATFKIKVKKIDLPKWRWEKDYLTNQIDKPWQEAGVISWVNMKPKVVLIRPIEKF